MKVISKTKTIVLFLALLALVSCSSHSKKENSEEKRKNTPEKNDQTQVIDQHVTTVHPNTFSPEEMKRIQALEHYRKLREEAFKLKKHSQKQIVKTKVKHLDENLSVKREIKKEKIVISPKLDKTEELKIQLEQNMAFHCIKFESRYGNSDECRQHTEAVLHDCEQKKESDGAINLITCLKKNL